MLHGSQSVGGLLTFPRSKADQPPRHGNPRLSFGKSLASPIRRTAERPNCVQGEDDRRDGCLAEHDQRNDLRVKRTGRGQCKRKFQRGADGRALGTASFPSAASAPGKRLTSRAAGDGCCAGRGGAGHGKTPFPRHRRLRRFLSHTRRALKIPFTHPNRCAICRGSFFPNPNFSRAVHGQRHLQQRNQIGRASCRERVLVQV